MDFSILFTWDGLLYLVILSLLEIVLGIDNIIFISIVTDRLPKNNKRRARNVGLSLALIIRLILLSFVAWIMQMTSPLFTVAEVEFSGQSLVLLIGGLFLIYKSVTEMHSSVAGHEEYEQKGKVTLKGVLVAEAFGQHVPKGYIYFAIVYSLIIEFLNIRMRKNKGV